MLNPLTSILRDKREDRFTAALAELLKDPLLAAAFVRACGVEGRLPAGIAAGSWSTSDRLCVAEGCFPDIVLKAAGASIFVEAKLGAPFHEGQIEGYARELRRRVQKDGEEVALIILAPAHRKHPLAQEAQTRLERIGLAEHVALRKVSWQEIRQAFDAVADQLSPDVRAFVRAYSGVLETEMGLIPAPLTIAEASILRSVETGRAFATCHALASELGPAVVSRMGGSRARWGQEGYFFGAHQREYWVGIWLLAWSKNPGSGPLFLQLRTRDTQLEGPSDLLSEQILDDGGLLVPLRLRPEMDYGDQLRCAVNDVCELVELDARSAGPLPVGL